MDGLEGRELNLPTRIGEETRTMHVRTYQLGRGIGEEGKYEAVKAHRGEHLCPPLRETRVAGGRLMVMGSEGWFRFFIAD